MAIFQVIDTTATGDTRYQGFVKDAANWALAEAELTNARDGQASVHAAMDLKANLASPTIATPTITGVSAAPTAVVNTNTTQLATCAFVMTQVSAPLIQVDGHTDATVLTAAQVSGTVIHNVAQGANNVHLHLPTAALGYSFVAVVGETQAGNTWKFQADTSDKIYLDGVAGTDNQSAIVTPAIGDYATFFTFKSGASTVDWICKSGYGSWSAGA
jgi:hypothetical protein